MASPRTPPEWMLAKLRTDLSCDAATGELRWVVPRRGTKVGSIAGSYDKHGYRSVRLYQTGETRNLFSHHIVWFLHRGEWPSSELDHINGVKDDNRIENLRLAERHQQMWNLRRFSTNTSGYTGVSFHPQTGKFRARMKVRGRAVHIGLFVTAREAWEARMRVERDLHGEFACSSGAQKDAA